MLLNFIIILIKSFANISLHQTINLLQNKQNNMQVKNYTSQNFNTLFSPTPSSNNQMYSLKQTQSPLTFEHFLSKNLHTDSLKTDQLNTTLQKNTSFTNLSPDSSQLTQSETHHSFQSTSKSSQPTYPTKQQPTQYSALGIKSSDQSVTDKPSYSYKQSTSDGSIQYSLMKIENQSLKKQNTKLSETLSKLRKQLEEKVSTLNKFNQLMKIKYKQIKDLKADLSQKQELLSTLSKQKQSHITIEQSTRLKQLLIRKTKQLDEINGKINNLEDDNFKNEVFQMKISNLYDQLEEQKSRTNTYLIENSALSQKIREFEEKVAVLQFNKQKNIAISKVAQIEQIQHLFKTPESSPTKSNKQSTHLTAFEEALRVQMKQIQQLKQVVDNSSQVVQKLRDNLVSSRRQIQQLRGEMKIQDLKATSERKKLIMQYRLQIHEKDNEIGSSLKRYKTLEQKYKNALADIKAKDDFFRQHLVGRVTETTIQEYIESALSHYTENFEDIISLKTENSSLKQKLAKYQKYEQEINQV